jgi:hypothetical protein
VPLHRVNDRGCFVAVVHRHGNEVNT